MDEKIECTILIPTFNRTTRLRRILDYYNKYGKKYKIIVADSSLPEKKKINKKTIALFPDLDLLYINKFSPNTTQFHKLEGAVKYVKTEYCVQTGDDDLIIPNGIERSIDFLKNHQDYSIAQGYIIFFFLKEDKNKKKFSWVPGYYHNSTEMENPVERVVKHFYKNTMPTLYAVYRTPLLKMIFEETKKYTDDDRFGELLPLLLTLVYGKMKYLNVFYAAREDTPNSSGKIHIDLDDYVKKGIYEKKYLKFRMCLTKHLNKKTGISIEKCEKVIDSQMPLYFSKHVKPTEKTSNFRKNAREMKKSLYKLKLPGFVYPAISKIYRKLFSRGLLKEIKKAENIVNYYHEDFNKIKEQVLRFSD